MKKVQAELIVSGRLSSNRFLQLENIVEKNI